MRQWRDKKMILEYRLKYGSKVYTIRAVDFNEALEKLRQELKVEIKENQVRISSVVRIQ